MEQSIKYIKEINPKSGNTLVFTFDTEIIDFEDASRYFEFLNQNFPETDILMIPNKYTIKELSPQEIDRFLGAISRRKKKEIIMKVVEKDYTATVDFGDLEVGATFKFNSSVWMKTEPISNIQTKINAVLLTTGTFDKFFKDTEKVGVITGSFVEE